jgi:simple sugar transport system ATP-binding protein
MVGEDTTVRKRDQGSVGKELLSISNVSAKGTSVRNGLINVSMSIFEHEIVGVAGVSGNGQSMLAEVISGLRKPDAGELSFDSQVSTNLSPKEVIKAGVGRIPEDRHRDGIIGSMTVAENLIIENLDNPKIRNFGFLNHDLINSSARELCEKYDVRGPGTHASAKFLSGGNIQKMILARVFNNGPKIILANQPTRGLDMGAASEVERRLLDARSRGAGTILISEDLDEILRLSDRILVIHGGILMETRNKDREQIGLMMAGEREC